MVANRKLWAWVSVGLLACGGEDGHEDRDAGEEHAGGSSTTGPSAGDAGVDAKVPGQLAPDGAIASGPGLPGNTCASVSTGVELQPVHLAFAFDVSGSMGNGRPSYHDRSKKWEPVVAATKQFFGAESATGLSASMTFFPSESSMSSCTGATYESPDVPMTSLPSRDFAQALDDVTPGEGEKWRGNTPTLAVMQGVSAFARAQRDEVDGRYAIVLVSDGYPQGCSDDKNIAPSVRVAEEARDANITTYVIGVKNPSGGPNTVAALNEIAVAGGTGEAVFIDTDDPAATAASFRSAVEQIRRNTISCQIDIPAEQVGADFDPRAVRVYFDGSAGQQALVYDKSCAGAGTWRYDDPENPTQIELCDQACTTVRADETAKLSVEFACEPVLVI